MKKNLSLIVIFFSFLLLISTNKIDASAVSDANHPSYSRLNSTQSARYEKVVKEVLKGVNKKWSAEEKLFYLHDYIVTHTTYRVNYKNSANQYGCMVEHEAQCAGYSLAFCDIANRMGIETQYILGQQMNHAWNAVKLHGKWYYIDCTFDDIGSGYFSTECRHTNFLRNEQGMRSTSHTGNDWRHGHGGAKVVGRYTSNTYENAEWRSYKQNKPFAYLSNGIAYLHTGDGSDAVYTYNCKRGKAKKVVENDDIKGSAAIAAKGTDFFVNGEDSIYYHNNAKNTTSRIYVLSEEEDKSGHISDMSIYGNYLRYDIGGAGTTPKDGIRCGYLDVRKAKNMLVKEIVLDKESLVLTKPGDSASLSVTAYGIDSYTWESDDPSVATVNNGVVTAVNAGGCYISVSGGGITDKCFVYVKRSYNQNNEYAKDTDKPDTTWQNDFYYYSYLKSGEIYISKYDGSARDLVIPSKAVIDGKEYRTVINGNLMESKSSSSRKNLVSIRFEEGVKLSGYVTIANGCENLMSIDLRGCDTSYLSNLLIAKNCQNLSNINMSGLDFGGLNYWYNIVENCPKLSMITTPYRVNPAGYASLQGKWRIKGNNEWGIDAYTSLKEAPANTEIYLYDENIKKGQSFINNGITYRVTDVLTDSVTGKASVTHINGKNADIPAYVVFKGIRFMVTSVDKKAAQNNKKLETLSIGACVNNIGDNAFNKCSKLKNIKVYSGVISKIGKNAFKGTNAKLKVKVPADMKDTYSTLFKNAGCPKNTEIKKW